MEVKTKDIELLEDDIDDEYLRCIEKCQKNERVQNKGF